MITLYDYELSGNCYKIRLLLSMLEIEYSKHTVEFYPAADHKSEWFKAINPLGTLPVLVDRSHEPQNAGQRRPLQQKTEKPHNEQTADLNPIDGLTLKDSAAILVYLATRYDKTASWYPSSDPAKIAQITEWLAFADGITASASQARLAEGFFYNVDADACRARAHQLFRILDEHLWFAEHRKQRWLVAGDLPTIADLACFPYIILSEEGSISRQDYPAIRRWTDRIKRIPGFIVMPGVFPIGPELSS